ncbi:MAG: hypothetical protein ABI281_05465 [Caldimonas sp.]
MFSTLIRRALPAFFATALVACGGGGSNDDNGSGVTPTPQPPVATPTASIALAPATLNIVAGTNSSSILTLTRGGGFAGAVSIAASGAPSGVTVASPAIAASGATSTVTVTVATSAAAGPSTVTFVATGTGVTIAPVTLALTVTAAPAGVTPIGEGILGEAAYDESGHVVALSADGSRVAIGAWLNDGANGTDSGHVRVYQKSGTTWTQLGGDIDGQAANDRFGTSLAMSADGSRVVVGAYLHGAGFTAAGQVRVYELVSGAWTPIGTAIDGGFSQGLGYAVSMSANGRRILVGVPGVNNTNGYARVYEQSGSDWVALGSVLAESGWDFGQALDMSDDGNRIAIGAPSGNGTSRPGTTYVYQWNGTVWAALGAPIVGEAFGDFAGAAVSLSSDGSRVAIGAPSNKGGDPAGLLATGQVRVYALNGTTWSQLGADIDGKLPANPDRFGESVALSGDGNRLIASTFQNAAARVYTYTGGAWVQIGADLTGAPALGVAMSTDGKTAAVGFIYFPPSATGKTQVYSVTP